MQCVLIAVGERMPAWVDEAAQDYSRRLPRTLSFRLVEIRPEPRREGRTSAQLTAGEARRIRTAIPRGSWIIALDEHGRGLTSRAYAGALQKWLESARDVAFLIGGPDGLDPTLKAAADLTLRLSDFTLPHGLARVVLLEQLYRATTILANHPYHRD